MLMLDRLYQAFDALAEKHALFKVETIGEAALLDLACLYVEGNKAHLPLIRPAQTQCTPGKTPHSAWHAPIARGAASLPGLLSYWLVPFR